MLDGSAMYPKGFHLAKQTKLPDNVNVDAPFEERPDATPTYYSTDFRFSSYFPDSSSERLVTGN